MAEVLLHIDQLVKRFGGLVATNHASLQVERGSIHALIGPNGAGKSTFFNVVSGAFPPTSGRLIFKGRDITGWKPRAIWRLGVGRTFQNLQIFFNMSALDNVMVGGHARSRGGFWAAALRLPPAPSQERALPLTFTWRPPWCVRDA